MSKLYQTRINLPEAVRSQMISLLNENLATGIDLALQSKQAHWNVKGPDFYQLHELFDAVYAQATEWVDSLAERATQLGGVAEGTLASVSARTRLPAYAPDAVSGRQHLVAMSGALGAFANGVRAAADIAEEAGDAGTTDLFTDLARASDKMLWFVESHLQSDS